MTHSTLLELLSTGLSVALRKTYRETLDNVTAEFLRSQACQAGKAVPVQFQSTGESNRSARSPIAELSYWLAAQAVESVIAAAESQLQAQQEFQELPQPQQRTDTPKVQTTSRGHHEYLATFYFNRISNLFAHSIQQQVDDKAVSDNLDGLVTAFIFGLDYKGDPRVAAAAAEALYAVCRWVTAKKMRPEWATKLQTVLPIYLLQPEQDIWSLASLTAVSAHLLEDGPQDIVFQAMHRSHARKDGLFLRTRLLKLALKAPTLPETPASPWKWLTNSLADAKP